MQITFGLQPRIPGAAQNNKPPANEDIIESIPIYKRLTALFEARKAFVDVENSLRLKKALRVKPQPMEHYSSGDKVFYKFGTDSRWHGPGTIIGTDNKVIFLRHGGNVISTSQSRIIKADIEQSGVEKVEQSSSCQELGLHDQGRKSESLKKKEININTQEKNDDSDTDVEEDELNNTPPVLPDIDERSNIAVSTENEVLGNEEHIKVTSQLPKAGDLIEYKEKEGDIWFRAVIIKRTSKSNVNRRVHYNIDREYGGPAGIVLEDYDWKIISKSDSLAKNKFRPGQSVHSKIDYNDEQIKKAESVELENDSYVVFIPKKDWSKPFVIEAKEKEIQNFDRYGAYKTVSDEGQPRLTS